MSELPQGWVLSSVSELAPYIQRGKSPKYAVHSELPVVNQKCIRWNKLETQYLKFIHPDQFPSWDEARYIRYGDILWNSTGTGTVGRAYFVSEADYTTPKVVDSHVTIVRVSDQVDPRYLFNWIKGPFVQHKIVDMCDGTTNQIELSRSAIAETEIPLAPLNEQKRIADKLDAVLARMDVCRDRLDRIPIILKRIRQAVVSAGTKGLMTCDWRMHNLGNSDKVITTTTLVEQCLRDRVITYGVIKLGDEIANGIPCLRTSNVRWLKIETKGMKRIAQVVSDNYSRTILQGGEVLVNVRGTLGGVAVATTDMIGWNVSREVAVIPVDQSKVNPQFLALWIGAEESQRWLRGVEKGVAYTGINIEDLRTIPLELPKLEEQAEIVRRVEVLFAYADRLEARYTAARAKVDKLTPATLAKAFRGELVPQDPNDEPASVLLERIKASRTEKPKANRGRNKAMRSAAKN